jgi:hypothetical protein
MKEFRYITKCILCKNIFLTLILSASGLFFNCLMAQEMVAKLTDTEIRSVIPILKEEYAGYTKMVQVVETELDVKHQLFLDIQSGKTDPLNWLKQHSKHIIVPPGAVYLPACSREASIKGWEFFEDDGSYLKPSAVPTAIFSYEKNFSAINSKLLGSTVTQESYSKFMENPYNTNDPSYAGIESILKDAESFYLKNGFSASYGLSYGTAVSFYHPDDEEYISGVVYNLNTMLLDPTYSDVVKQCRSHIMGPVIEIKAEYKLLDKLFGSPDIGPSINGNTKNSLKKAGITEDRYAMVKVSLIKARQDSEYPDAIEVPSFDFTPVTDEEKEMAKVFESLKQDALARKSNIIIYNKFKAELDPLIDTMQKFMGQE